MSTAKKIFSVILAISIALGIGAAAAVQSWAGGEEIPPMKKTCNCTAQTCSVHASTGACNCAAKKAASAPPAAATAEPEPSALRDFAGRAISWIIGLIPDFIINLLPDFIINLLPDWIEL